MDKPKAAKPTAAQMLAAVPQRNVRVEVERHGHELALWVPVKQRWYNDNPLTRALLPMKGRRRVILDRLGREVWEACDGRRSLEAIAELFAQKHRLRFHEARLAVGQFLRDMTERGCVVMVVPPVAESDRRPPQAAMAVKGRDVRRGGRALVAGGHA